MPKIEQAPWCFVGQQTIKSGQQKRIKCQESDEAGAGPVQPGAAEAGAGAGGGQQKHHRFSPDWSGGRMKQQQAVEVKMPGMDMRRIAAGPAEPGLISANGIQQTAGICKK